MRRSPSESQRPNAVASAAKPLVNSPPQLVRRWLCQQQAVIRQLTGTDLSLPVWRCHDEAAHEPVRLLNLIALTISARERLDGPSTVDPKSQVIRLPYSRCPVAPRDQVERPRRRDSCRRGLPQSYPRPLGAPAAIRSILKIPNLLIVRVKPEYDKVFPMNRALTLWRIAENHCEILGRRVRRNPRFVIITRATHSCEPKRDDHQSESRWTHLYPITSVVSAA